MPRLDVALPPTDIRFISCGIAPVVVGAAAVVPGAGAVVDDGPVPRSEVALPPIGIRFIWLGIAPGVVGIVVLAPGGVVDGAGCAQTGPEIASAAMAAPIKLCFTEESSLSYEEILLKNLVEREPHFRLSK